MIEQIKQALEALYPISHNSTDDPRGQSDIAIKFLRQAIEQAENQEAVAWGIANTRPTERNPLMMVMLDEPAPSHLVVPLYTHPQPTERNFCQRCGKRTTDIHTCTPPKD